MSAVSRSASYAEGLGASRVPRPSGLQYAAERLGVSSPASVKNEAITVKKAAKMAPKTHAINNKVSRQPGLRHALAAARKRRCSPTALLCDAGLSCE